MNAKKRKGSAVERNIVSRLRDKGFAVVRAPASGSKRKDPIPDIIALKNGVIILIEMKSRKDGKIYVRREQAEGIIEFARKSGGSLFLGVKKPGVLKFIPFEKLRRTETGNYVADSEIEGLDLEDLVRLVEAKISRTLDNFL
uniref:Holliday junction resolvase Hjc n=1 Tax=Saccharolobus solfataricus (strain ATCC 35092 / DSM 1617 / JCM 11322 / P2) TaxID=273057 RepID=UPI00067E64C5|nr:Chain A, Holliday junction resolvase Hjc [Saccharolobus solfataricus P2]4TKD_B Chain B, Holliday junction resolvase Hjc [Saccharolobus solfataricus P2]4TKD_C Chain C, Holliday junction resolvase Hjc [Saccharolobus solfataricus P2]4TKD_D Chain D, Holliday junction resolvase Hjc [Saccharolobus solfataricus P2]